MKISLSETQARIVNFGEGALLVVAGPGAGKTRVLTERIRRLLSEGGGHFRVLALTFTNKAANEMHDRLIEFSDINERVFISTLHSFCLEVLSNRGKAVGIIGRPNILQSNQDRKQLLLGAILDDQFLSSHLDSCQDIKQKNKKLGEWLGAIDKAKKNLMPPEAIEEPIYREVYELYEQTLKASNTIDFDDLLMLTYQLFIDRPKIADFYRRQYRYICIDEAQDLNEAQYQVIKALCGDSYRNVMMVGDPKQAIFGWTGADPKYLDLFLQDFQAQKIELKDNFRSSNSVVSTARMLYPSFRSDVVFPIEGEIGLLSAQDEKHEAELILETLEKLVSDGHPEINEDLSFSDFAILGRTRYALSAIEQEFSNAKIPFYKQLSIQEESESDLLKDFELCLKLLVNSQDRFHLNILRNRWKIKSNAIFDKTKYANAHDLVSQLCKHSTCHGEPIWSAIKAMKWNPQDNNCQFRSALDVLNNYASNAREEERALIMHDTQLWRRHWDIFLRSQKGGSLNLSSFLSQIAMGTTQQTSQEGVALLTVHSAKGLEFNVVFIPGMTEGTFPDYRASGEALDEERRNFFVAITRARRVLYFSYPKMKMMPWGDSRPQQPSRYLRELNWV